MPKIEGTCLACGRVFRYYLTAQTGRYCSNSCSLRHRPRRPRLGEERPCPVCGTGVYRNASQAAKGEGVYCSRQCTQVALTKAPVIKPCARCGREMRHRPSQAQVQYCSKACEGAARVKRPLAEMYNGRPVKLDSKGYRMVWEPEHPNKTMKGWQHEHRLVVERVLGRYLVSGEHVDHINRDKRDNRPENLQVLSQVDHAIKSASEWRAGIDAMRTELAEYRRRYGPLEQEP